MSNAAANASHVMRMVSVRWTWMRRECEYMNVQYLRRTIMNLWHQLMMCTVDTEWNKYACRSGRCLCQRLPNGRRKGRIAVVIRCVVLLVRSIRRRTGKNIRLPDPDGITHIHAIKFSVRTSARYGTRTKCTPTTGNCEILHAKRNGWLENRCDMKWKLCAHLCPDGGHSVQCHQLNQRPRRCWSHKNWRKTEWAALINANRAYLWLLFIACAEPSACFVVHTRTIINDINHQVAGGNSSVLF